MEPPFSAALAFWLLYCCVSGSWPWVNSPVRRALGTADHRAAPMQSTTSVERCSGDVPSEIRGRQCVKAVASPRVNLTRSLEDAIAITVESDQKPIFGLGCCSIDLGKSAFLDNEGHFARIVMSPEANTMVLGIVAAALIGKIDRHERDRILVSSPCPISLASTALRRCLSASAYVAACYLLFSDQYASGARSLSRVALFQDERPFDIDLDIGNLPNTARCPP